MSSMTVLIKNCTAGDGVVLGVSCLLPLGAEQDQLPCGSTGTSSGNCQETETCMVRACRTHSTTASPKPSFRATWRVGNAVVGRGDAGRISSNSTDPSPCQSCSQGPLTLEEDFCWIVHVPSDDPIGQGTEPNWPSFPPTSLDFGPC